MSDHGLVFLLVTVSHEDLGSDEFVTTFALVLNTN